MTKLTEREVIVALRGHPVWAREGMYPDRLVDVDVIGMYQRLGGAGVALSPGNKQDLLVAVAEIEAGKRRCCVCGGFVDLPEKGDNRIGSPTNPEGFVHWRSECLETLNDAASRKGIAVYGGTPSNVLAAAMADAQNIMRKAHPEKMVPFTIPDAVETTKATREFKIWDWVCGTDELYKLDTLYWIADNATRTGEESYHHVGYRRVEQEKDSHDCIILSGGLLVWTKWLQHVAPEQQKLLSHAYPGAVGKVEVIPELTHKYFTTGTWVEPIAAAAYLRLAYSWPMKVAKSRSRNNEQSISFDPSLPTEYPANQFREVDAPVAAKTAPLPICARCGVEVHQQAPASRPGIVGKYFCDPCVASYMTGYDVGLHTQQEAEIKQAAQEFDRLTAQRLPPVFMSGDLVGPKLR